MFVKVEGTTGTDSIYECDSAHITNLSEDEALLRMETNSPLARQELHLMKQVNSVYLMNSQGKTIDSYCWHIKRQG